MNILQAMACRKPLKIKISNSSRGRGYPRREKTENTNSPHRTRPGNGQHGKTLHRPSTTSILRAGRAFVLFFTLPHGQHPPNRRPLAPAQRGHSQGARSRPVRRRHHAPRHVVRRHRPQHHPPRPHLLHQLRPRHPLARVHHRLRRRHPRRKHHRPPHQRPSLPRRHPRQPRRRAHPPPRPPQPRRTPRRRRRRPHHLRRTPRHLHHRRLRKKGNTSSGAKANTPTPSRPT